MINPFHSSGILSKSLYAPESKHSIWVEAPDLFFSLIFSS
jgi:hypothetical protein